MKSLSSLLIFFNPDEERQNESLLLRSGCNNNNSQITNSLPKTKSSHFTEFSMNDRNTRPLAPVSAVYTLYSGWKLVYCGFDMNGSTSVFLDIGSHRPVSLFGGNTHLASIYRNSEVIFINRDSIIK